MSDVLMGIGEISETLPHRYPFLLIDRIIELVPGEKAVGIKNVTYNEDYFQGHFPGNPVMPGVLMVEAMAQVGAIAILKLPKNKGKTPLFTGIDKLRFKRQVVPGDSLTIEVKMTKIRGPVGKGEGFIKVEGELVCKGELMFALME